MIKWRILRWEYPGLSGQATKSHHVCLYKREAKRFDTNERRQGEQESRNWDDGAPRQKNPESHQKLAETRNRLSSKAPRESASLLTLGLWPHDTDFGLQAFRTGSKQTSVVFKTPGLWSSVVEKDSSTEIISGSWGPDSRREELRALATMAGAQNRKDWFLLGVRSISQQWL